MTNSFSLRKLELALPFIKELETNPKMFVNLAAIAIADETSLKLYANGNTDILDTFKDKIYEMDTEEVATLLANFTQCASKFSMILSGLSPEQIQKIMKKKATVMDSALDES